jgi:hypothetical protein
VATAKQRRLALQAAPSHCRNFSHSNSPRLQDNRQVAGSLPKLSISNLYCLRDSRQAKKNDKPYAL